MKDQQAAGPDSHRLGAGARGTATALYVQMKSIYHIAEVREFEHGARHGEYVPDRFEADGFIHCSYAHQVKGVAESKFRGKKGLVLLQIDRSRVPSPIVDENLVGGEVLFLHIYGPLPMTAIACVREVSVPEHASFELPCNVDVQQGT